jgi:hypothetical protein
MIEVFKTNITHEGHSTIILNSIHQQFKHYTANFDLDDCDHILRVNCTTGPVDVASLQLFLGEHGCIAEILPDEIHTPSYPITPANALSFISRFYHHA